MAPAEQSGLLTLPSKLRLRILHYVLESPYLQGSEPEILADHPEYPAWWGTRSMSAVFAVNHQLHMEAEEVLYSDNAFKFCGNLCDRDLFLACISERAKSLIRRLHLDLPISTTRDEGLTLHQIDFARSLVEALPGLATVQVSVHLLTRSVHFDEREMVADNIVRFAAAFRDVESLNLMLVTENGFFEHKEAFMQAKAAVDNRAFEIMGGMPRVPEVMA